MYVDLNKYKELISLQNKILLTVRGGIQVIQAEGTDVDRERPLCAILHQLLVASHHIVVVVQVW